MRTRLPTHSVLIVCGDHVDTAHREEALSKELRHLRVLAYTSAADRVPQYVPQDPGLLHVRIHSEHASIWF